MPEASPADRAAALIELAEKTPRVWAAMNGS